MERDTRSSEQWVSFLSCRIFVEMMKKTKKKHKKNGCVLKQDTNIAKIHQTILQLNLYAKLLLSFNIFAWFFSFHFRSPHGWQNNIQHFSMYEIVRLKFSDWNELKRVAKRRSLSDALPCSTTKCQEKKWNPVQRAMLTQQPREKEKKSII